MSSCGNCGGDALEPVGGLLNLGFGFVGFLDFGWSPGERAGPQGLGGVEPVAVRATAAAHKFLSYRSARKNAGISLAGGAVHWVEASVLQSIASIPAAIRPSESSS